ncbi:MAG: hypothetical protein WBD40_25630, partial [Tepidisphaeraceae bacterium]
ACAFAFARAGEGDGGWDFRRGNEVNERRLDSRPLAGRGSAVKQLPDLVERGQVDVRGLLPDESAEAA